MADQRRLTVQQIHSGIGCARRQRATLRGLGLKHPGHKRAVADTPQTRGMIAKVAHLVRIVSEAG